MPDPVSGITTPTTQKPTAKPDPSLKVIASKEKGFQREITFSVPKGEKVEFGLSGLDKKTNTKISLLNLDSLSSTAISSDWPGRYTVSRVKKDGVDHYTLKISDNFDGEISVHTGGQKRITNTKDPILRNELMDRIKVDQKVVKELAQLEDKDFTKVDPDTKSFIPNTERIDKFKPFETTASTLYGFDPKQAGSLTVQDIGFKKIVNQARGTTDLGGKIVSIPATLNNVELKNLDKTVAEIIPAPAEGIGSKKTPLKLTAEHFVLGYRDEELKTLSHISNDGHVHTTPIVIPTGNINKTGRLEIIGAAAGLDTLPVAKQLWAQYPNASEPMIFTQVEIKAPLDPKDPNKGTDTYKVLIPADLNLAVKEEKQGNENTDKAIIFPRTVEPYKNGADKPIDELLGKLKDAGNLNPTLKRIVTGG